MFLCKPMTTVADYEENLAEELLASTFLFFAELFGGYRGSKKYV